MNRIVPFLAVLGLVLVPTVSFAQAVLAGPEVNPSNGHTYYLLEPASWTESEAAAISLGGHLATIRNVAEQTWVFDTFGSLGGVNRSLWIGYNDSAIEGAFEWASGESPTYSNWLPGQPDNSTAYDAGGEDFVHLMRTNNGFGHPAGLWNDMDGADSFPEFQNTAGVVEVIPSPNALCLAILSMSCIAGARTRISR